MSTHYDPRNHETGDQSCIQEGVCVNNYCGYLAFDSGATRSERMGYSMGSSTELAVGNGSQCAGFRVWKDVYWQRCIPMHVKVDDIWKEE
jgi:hypothetical protein